MQHSISRLDELVSEFLADQPAVFHAFGHDISWISAWWDGSGRVREQVRKRCRASSKFEISAIYSMKLAFDQDENELAVMREAAGSAEAHKRAIPGDPPRQI
ncbi:MAG: hypothetical protein P0107_01375 [Nitrosomonas sp.]|nr:hypothetical protein [Nitrosomonas sp.]